jgi:hypothetical protein
LNQPGSQVKPHAPWSHDAVACAGGAAHGVQLLPHEVMAVFDTQAVPHLWKPLLHSQTCEVGLQTFSFAAVHWLFVPQPVLQLPSPAQNCPDGQLLAVQTHAWVDRLQLFSAPEHWPFDSQPGAHVRWGVQ